MEVERCIGQMERSMRANGCLEEPMARANSLTRREKYTMGSGGRTKRTDSEPTHTQTEPSTKENGTKICSMEEAQRPGQTAANSVENMLKAGKMALESTCGQMEHATKDSGKITKSQVTATISGAMAESTSATGRGTSWTTSASTLGKTAACMRASMSKIRSMAMVSTPGVIRRSTPAGGSEASSTAWESLSLERVPSESSAFGKTARR